MKKKFAGKGSAQDIVCKKDDILELDILNIGNDGEGIGRIEGYTLFVKDALAGDRVRVKVMKTKKHFGYAKLLEIITPSADRVTPLCPVAAKCGGCKLQHCSYERQLRYKEEKVKDCLERIGGFTVSFVDEKNGFQNGNCKESGSGDEKNGFQDESCMEPGSGMESETGGADKEAVKMERIMGMEVPYHYRNKAQFPVGVDKNGNLVAGFYAGRTHQIIPNTDCMIQHPCNHLILETILSFMKEYQIPAYDETAHTGLVRHILTRVGAGTGEIMVCLVVNGEKLPHAEKLVERLLAVEFTEISGRENFNAGPGGERFRIKSICLNHNTEKTNVILGNSLSVLYGREYIEDYIGDIRFQISPLSFYQVNPVQTEKLYRTALEYAGLSGGETVWDLYCGIGTISLFLAKKAGKVCGVEIVPQAVEDAGRNAKLNHIENAEFYCGAAEEAVPEIYEKSGGALKADVVTLDPPRKGCEEKLLETVIRMEPKRIVYVSCDPATLARDLKYLCEGEYELKKVRACDMFGFSGHVECVAMLQRK